MNDNSKNTTSTNLDTQSIEKEIECKNTSVKASINQEEDKVNCSSKLIQLKKELITS